jgi:single stranded DNA-binding protein
MEASMSANITIVARCGADPETKENDYGGVCRVNMATNKSIKGEKITTWWRVTAWGRVGEMLAKARKGCRVVVCGEVYASTYEGRDGQTKQTLEVKASTVSLIDWPDDAPKPARPDEDIPF